jgi:superkiller protein 3
MALNYFYQYSCNITSAHDSKLPLINKAKDCLINAVNLQPDNYLFWNSLGIIYSSSQISKLDMAQHCFIKSLKLNDSMAVTWTNLGVFYLLNSEFQLAHECFKKSQALDPEYSVAWIGQAFIAETVDMEQCVDLYRHAVELMLHTEALYGYARIVCKITTDPEQRNKNIYKDYIQFLNAIPLASDCLVKYTDRIDSNQDAYFLAGVLFEKLALPLTSIGFYEKALEISAEDDTSEIVMLSRRSYARLLCELDNYELALIQYKKIDVKNSIEDMFALAKVFFKLAKYQQCFKIFENALGICSEKEKSIVFTAMGMAQSKYNIQEAITSFFKSFQCKFICIQSLFALCSIGLLKNDMKLINAVFKELDVIQEQMYRFDILKLKSIYYCLQKDFVKATICISKYVHENPNDLKGWTELCLCLKRAKKFDMALEIGHVIFKTNTQANLIRNTVLFDCIQYLLLQKLKQNKFKDEDGKLLKTFEKTLHMYPANLSSWNSFSQFLSSYEMENRNFKDISLQIEAVLA